MNIYLKIKDPTNRLGEKFLSKNESKSILHIIADATYGHL